MRKVTKFFIIFTNLILIFLPTLSVAKEINLNINKNKSISTIKNIKDTNNNTKIKNSISGIVSDYFKSIFNVKTSGDPTTNKIYFTNLSPIPGTRIYTEQDATFKATISYDLGTYTDGMVSFIISQYNIDGDLIISHAYTNTLIPQGVGTSNFQATIHIRSNTYSIRVRADLLNPNHILIKSSGASDPFHTELFTDPTTNLGNNYDLTPIGELIVGEIVSEAIQKDLTKLINASVGRFAGVFLNILSLMPEAGGDWPTRDLGTKTGTISQPGQSIDLGTIEVPTGVDWRSFSLEAFLDRYNDSEGSDKIYIEVTDPSGKQYRTLKDKLLIAKPRKGVWHVSAVGYRVGATFSARFQAEDYEGDRSSPSINILYPHDNITLSGIPTLYAVASDDWAVKQLEFQYSIGFDNWQPITGPDSSNGVVSQLNTEGSYSLMFDTTNVNYALLAWMRVRAIDINNNPSEWVEKSIKINNRSALNQIQISEKLNPTSVLRGAELNVSGRALYNNGAPVSIETVNINLNGQIYSRLTDNSGFYSANITSPNNTGQYPVRVTISQGSISATSEQTLIVNDMAIISSSLTNGYVLPSFGTVDTDFVFRVKYTNSNNIFPTKSLVYINGIPHKMLQDTPGQIVDGVNFIFTIKGSDLLGIQNKYYFEFNDKTDNYKFPTFGSLSGPSIPETHDIAIQNVSIEPATPKADEQANIRFEIKNNGTMPEQNIPLRVTVNGTEIGTQTIPMLWVGQTSDIYNFSWTPPVSDNDQNFNIVASAGPVSGETNTGDNTASMTKTVKAENGNVSGYVFDQFSNPVEGAKIKVKSSSINDFGSVQSYRTSDNHGYYKLELRPGTYTLEATREDSGSQQVSGIVVRSKQETQNIHFTLTSNTVYQLTSGDRDEYPHWTQQVAGHPQRICFIRGSQIWSVKFDGTDQRQLTGGDGQVQAVQPYCRISPNGLDILIIGTKDGKTGFWVLDAQGVGIPGANPLKLDGNAYPPFDYSPSGYQIVYRKNTPQLNSLWIYDTSNGNDRYLVSGINEFLDWAPNSNYIIAKNKKIRVSDGSIEEIPNAQNCQNPSWLPNLSGILYDCQTNNSYDLWLYKFGQEPIRLTYWESFEQFPAINNAGSEIIFSTNKGDTTGNQKYIFKMPFSTPLIYFSNISATPNTFSPNGDGNEDTINFSYDINVTSFVTLKIYNSQGKLVKRLIDNQSQSAGNHIISWDGKNDDGLTQDAGMYFYTLDAHDVSNNFVTPIISRIGLIKNKTNLDCVAREANQRVGEWYGNNIVCTDFSYNIIKYIDGNKTTLPRQGENPSWSSDGSKILYTTLDNKIAYINQDSSGYTEVTSLNDNPGYSNAIANFSDWSASGTDVIYAQKFCTSPCSPLTWEIFKENINTHQRWMLTTQSSDEGEFKDTQPAFSPNGNKIVWASNINGISIGTTKTPDIWTMNSDGSGKQQLTLNPYWDQFPIFAPDGQNILYGSNRYSQTGNYDLILQNYNSTTDYRALLKDYISGTPSSDGSKILISGAIIELFLSTSKGAIEGNVKDYFSLNPLENITVDLIQNSSVIATTQTNAQGGYQFYNFDAGDYTLKAYSANYSQAEVQITLQSGSILRKDIKLTPLSLAEIVVPSTSFSGITTLGVDNASRNTETITYEYQAQTEGAEVKDASESQQAWTTIGTESQYNSLIWDSGGLASGDYQVRTTPKDSADTSGLPSITTLNIDNTSPTATITSPSNNSKVNGITSIEANTSNLDIAGVSFQYKLSEDGIWVPINIVDTDQPYSVQWDATNLEKMKNYDLRAVAIDQLGNIDENANKITVRVLDIQTITSEIDIPAGWNMISMPYEPVNSNPLDVFKDELGNAIPISGNLHRYDLNAQGYVTYFDFSPDDFGQVKRGDGYWLNLFQPTKIKYQAWIDSNYEVNLPTIGWYMIGGASQDINIADWQIRNNSTGETKSFSDVIDQWLQDPIITYDNTNQEYITIGIKSINTDFTLRAWTGYWVYANQSNLTLIMP